MMTKKDELKRLFYSNLTSIELQNKLNLTNDEYQKILLEVKKELGLPSKYRRTPHRYGKYVKDAYFIKKHSQKDQCEILTYSPTKEDAEEKLRLFDDGISVFTIEQATDDHMKDLIHDDYFNKKMVWSEILKKYQIPYNKFYQLLNEIKEDLGLSNTRTAQTNRYIYRYKRNGKYCIKKIIDGKISQFGYYNSLNIAVHVRDYLEEISWNKTRWLNERDKIVEEAHGN